LAVAAETAEIYFNPVIPGVTLKTDISGSAEAAVRVAAAEGVAKWALQVGQEHAAAMAAMAISWLNGKSKWIESFEKFLPLVDHGHAPHLSPWSLCTEDLVAELAAERADRERVVRLPVEPFLAAQEDQAVEADRQYLAWQSSTSFQVQRIPLQSEPGEQRAQAERPQQTERQAETAEPQVLDL
jgi:hypothetical protein